MKHQGASLIIALSMLLVLSLLGLSTIKTTAFQERMSYNLQDKTLSFSAAESALNSAEAWLLNQSAQPPVNIQCQSNNCVKPLYEDIDLASQSDSFWAANGIEMAQSIDKIHAKPRFLVEFIQFVPDTPMVGQTQTQSSGVYYYQITARSIGQTDSAITLLQSTLARRF